MKFTMTSNFDEIAKNIEKKVAELNGPVSFDTLFTKKIMNRVSKFDSFSELLDAGNYDIKTQEDFKAIPDDEFDEHIRKHTSFDNWQDMMSTAGKEYALSQLKF